MDIERFSLNYWLFYQINHRRHPVLDVFYRHFYFFGKGWFGALLGVLLLITKDSKLFQYWLVLILQTLVVKGLKYTLRAKRPPATLRKVYALERLRLKSFPSGDTAMATAIALSLMENSPYWLRPALLLYPLLIGYGRVYMGAHFPLDVVAGWAIGFLCFLLVFLFY